MTLLTILLTSFIYIITCQRIQTKLLPITDLISYTRLQPLMNESSKTI